MRQIPDIALSRLLQLASPTLPVGAYSYSQGLEAAVEAGIVRDAESARRWIEDVLNFSVARMEAPLFVRLYRAWHAHDDAAAARWNALLLASRESAELRAESVQMGYSLVRLLGELGESGGPGAWDEASFPAAFAYAAARWRIEQQAALVAYLWTWAENQVMAAVKVVPLGQTEGQKMLLVLGGRLPEVAARAAALDDGGLANLAPGLALLSACHETQYSRLFRS
jgi:urease accessory protein